MLLVGFAVDYGRIERGDGASVTDGKIFKFKVGKTKWKIDFRCKCLFS